MQTRTLCTGRPGRTSPPAQQRQRGQGLVEIVLVLPVLLVLVFGIVEFGNAWRTYQLVTNTAREAARQAVLPSVNQDSVNSVIETRLSENGLDPAAATVIYACHTENGTQPNICNSTGDATEVRLEYPYQFRLLGPVVNLMCAGCGSGYGTISLNSQTTMRAE